MNCERHSGDRRRHRVSLGVRRGCAADSCRRQRARARRDPPGSDGRESLLLLFSNDPNRLHSQLFLHGVLGWVSGGTYLGERRIDLSAQIDDIFLASRIYTGGTYRLDDRDLRAALAWRGPAPRQASTPTSSSRSPSTGQGRTAATG